MPRFHARIGDDSIEGWGKDKADAYCLRLGGTQLRWSAIPRGLAERPELRGLLSQALRESELEAFFWECRPWPAEADPLFEFVLVPTPAFGPMRASPAAFSAHFDDELVARFDNLGKDARLIAPRPFGRRDHALHLASFVRDAPAEQVDALWIAAGRELAAWRRAERGPSWLSTSGLGVPWLHLRLDSRPKYISHAEYRREV